MITVIPEPIPPITRGAVQNTTLTVVVQDSMGTEVAPTTLSCVLTSPDPGITITASGGTITIQGQYLALFTDQFVYVNKGESDKTQTPIVARFDQLPPNQTFFRLNQDGAGSREATFRITATDSTGAIYTADLVQTVNNSEEAIRNIVANYYP
jgi:hypothetical protein